MTDPGERPVLELRRLRKDFGGRRVVDELSLAAGGGSFFSLLGPSGCGKTTVLRMIAGFEDPTEGEVWLNGALVNGLKPYQRNVSTVFQSYALFPHLTVQENVEFGLRRKKEKNPARRAQEALAMVHLEKLAGSYPRQLSGGERQRVALARSLVLEPEVLLLDEPLAALDPQLRKQMRTELKELQRRAGIAFIFVTHDQEEALSMSDRMAVMNAGRIEQIGSPEEIYLRPCSRFVAEFLGAMNWLGQSGVRPESMRVSLEAPRNGFHAARATVVDALFLGHRVQLTTRLESGERVVADMARADAAFHPGQSVHVFWNPADEMPLH
jgi:ABC-type Fe3+/spermidine/putrescine transport system ATPase subunit